MRWTRLLPPRCLSPSSPAPGERMSPCAQSCKAGSGWRQLSFYSKGSSQGHGIGRKILQARVLDCFKTSSPHNYCNCWRKVQNNKKKKAKKVLHFPKTCEVLFWLLPSASFTPAGTGLNSGAREKNRNFKKKTGIFAFRFPCYGRMKFWQKCLCDFFSYELKEKGFNFFPLANRYFRISCISQL